MWVVQLRKISVTGVLTENDILAALVEGTEWECKIMDWLKGGYDAWHILAQSIRDISTLHRSNFKSPRA